MSELVPQQEHATITSKDIFRQIKKNELILPCPEAFSVVIHALEVHNTNPEENPDADHPGASVFSVALPPVMLALEEKRELARIQPDPAEEDLEPAHVSYIRQIAKVCHIIEASRLVKARLEAENKGQRPQDIPQDPRKYLHIKVDEVTASEANLQVGIDTVVDFGSNEIEGYAFIEDAEMNQKDENGNDVIGEDGYPVADSKRNQRASRLIKALSKTKLITFKVYPAPYEHATEEEIEEYLKEISPKKEAVTEPESRTPSSPRFARAQPRVRKPHFTERTAAPSRYNIPPRRHY